MNFPSLITPFLLWLQSIGKNALQLSSPKVGQSSIPEAQENITQNNATNQLVLNNIPKNYNTSGVLQLPVAFAKQVLNGIKDSNYKIAITIATIGTSSIGAYCFYQHLQSKRAKLVESPVVQSAMNCTIITEEDEVEMPQNKTQLFYLKLIQTNKMIIKAMFAKVNWDESFIFGQSLKALHAKGYNLYDIEPSRAEYYNTTAQKIYYKDQFALTFTYNNSDEQLTQELYEHWPLTWGEPDLKAYHNKFNYTVIKEQYISLCQQLGANTNNYSQSMSKLQSLKEAKKTSNDVAEIDKYLEAMTLYYDLKSSGNKNSFVIMLDPKVLEKSVLRLFKYPDFKISFKLPNWQLNITIPIKSYRTDLVKKFFNLDITLKDVHAIKGLLQEHLQQLSFHDGVFKANDSQYQVVANFANTLYEIDTKDSAQILGLDCNSDAP